MLRIAVIGCGKITQVRHAPEYAENPDCELIGWYDALPERAQAMADQYGGAVCSSIDELPQLFNVLRGEMSLVGPWPALPREVARYDQRARGRLTVKPGMTCYWQIRPDWNSLCFQEWLELDLQYIRERSIPVDLLILLKTIGAVARMDGV